MERIIDRSAFAVLRLAEWTASLLLAGMFLIVVAVNAVLDVSRAVGVLLTGRGRGVSARTGSGGA